MKKRILATILAVIMMIGILPVLAEDGNITVYLSVSRHGEILQSKDGQAMVYLPVTLTGKESYCLDDVFLAGHILYYEDGTGGYATSIHEQYGLSIDKIWGDSSGKFGYQVNSGNESVMGPGHIVEDGDLVDVALYESFWPDTEAYATFDVAKKEIFLSEELTLTLQVSGFDADGNTVFSPCSDATITVNGVATQIVTDANGQATISLDEVGSYVISAQKSKNVSITIGENETTEITVTAITAPVCKVTVKERPEMQLIHNIAAQYATGDFASAGGNLPWIIADMMTYESLYPDSDFCFTEEKKQAGVAQLIANAENATSPGDLAKTILALRALGYDAKKIYTKSFTKINLVEKLIALVDAQSPDVTNIFTLPYVMIALSQSEDYATSEQKTRLLNAAIASKSAWQALETDDYYVGTDGITPMLLALAPYYETNTDVKNAVDETILILKGEQREDGLIDGFEGYEAASTGLAICALATLGVDVQTVKNGEKSLIDGLLSTANENLTGFPNAFATEQGFRGLLAWQLFLKGRGAVMYDFSDYPMNKANLSGTEHCPVVFEVTPVNAIVTIAGQTAIKSNCFDLTAGEYTYTVSASGYTTETGTVVVTEEEQESRIAKKITISLTSSYSGSGGGSGIVKEPSHEEEQETKEPKQETTEQEQQPETEIFTEETFADVKQDDWYYQAVEYVYENHLFQGTGNGFEPESFMTRAMLVTVLYRFAKPKKVEEQNPFADIPADEWYAESVAWAANNKIVSGVSETAFDPNTNITREQIALILYRYATLYDYDTEISKKVDIFSYNDAGKVSDYAREAIEYAVATGVMNGKSEDTLAPGENATRAEVATMLMRFAGVK